MKFEQIEVNGIYEARVPWQGGIKAKQTYRLLRVVAKGHAYDLGNLPKICVIYAAPWARSGRGVALISADKLRLPRQRALPKQNASVDPPAAE